MKTFSVDYAASLAQGKKTIESAYKDGHINRTQAREYTAMAEKNYRNRNFARQMERVYGDKVKVVEE